LTDFYSRLCCIIDGLKSVREVFADERLFWRDKGLVFYSHEALRADEEELGNIIAFENAERLHRSGKRVFVWTVNEKETMKKLVSLNVDAILTNDPALCKTVTDQYSSDMMNMVQRVRSAFAFL